MDGSPADGWEGELERWLAPFLARLGRKERRRWAPFYLKGLILPGERKSIEPMAARVDPARVGAAHQSLHHFVAEAAWDDAALLGAVRDYALPAMLERGPVRAWLVDDTGLPKKGLVQDTCKKWSQASRRPSTALRPARRALLDTRAVPLSG